MKTSTTVDGNGVDWYSFIDFVIIFIYIFIAMQYYQICKEIAYIIFTIFVVFA